MKGDEHSDVPESRGVHNDTGAGLVANALADPQAFAAIVVRFEEPLRRYLRRITDVPQQDLDDLLQDTFLKAYQNLNAYNANYPLSSWMYRIARTTAISEWRKRSARPTDYTLDDESVYTVIPDELNIELELIGKEAAQAVPHALARLRPEYRDVLTLRFFEEKCYDEISDIIQKPPGTVATLIHRAKRDLKTHLTDL